MSGEQCLMCKIPPYTPTIRGNISLLYSLCKPARVTSAEFDSADGTTEDQHSFLS